MTIAKILIGIGFSLCSLVPLTVFGEDTIDEQQAKAMVKEALEYWRGQSSKMRAAMHIHREAWSRKTEMQIEDNKLQIFRDVFRNLIAF